MGAIQDILQKFGNETVEIIRANMSRAGQNASGRTSRELRSQTPSETRLVVDGPRHVFVLETGRKETTSTKEETPTLRSKIEQWIKDKPIPGGNAFAISKVIHEKGTKLFREGGRTDIITPAVSDERIDKLAAEIAEASFNMTLRVIDKETET